MLVKHHEGGENQRISTTTDDLDTVRGLSGRSSSTKILKADKDYMRSLESLEKHSPFKSRGLSIQKQMGITELAQLEDQTWREDIQSTSSKLNNKRK